ncbi:MAG: metallophosphoesterase, partial [Acidobacteria bacterium]|nr:metallophosphoesterase [Acidobacteriota bacterium]
MKRILVLILNFLCLAAFLTAAPAARRVVAIADIHGDYDAFVRIAQRAGLLDAQMKWAGRDTVFVQTGDFTDRGPKTRAVMDFLISLQNQRRNQVHILLGNHEYSNILGDLRYVVPADYASFADAKSEQRRQDAFKAYAALRPNPPPEAKWMDEHPPGFIEHREAFSPGGRYGRWLRSLPAVAQVDDTIFLHGGISPQLAAWSVRQINDALAAEIRNFDAYKKYLVDQKIALSFFTLEELAEAAGAALRATDEKDVDRKKILEG